MLNIVLFGPPGAGKGTQSDRLIEKYKLVHLSTGNLFRKNIAEKTQLGLLAQDYMNKGQLVPDEVTIKMLEEAFEESDKTHGFIFDGFPRTNAQAKALDELLYDKNTSINLMLSLHVEENELKDRLMKRAKMSQRPDDATPEVIEKRILVYKKETLPVREFYQKQGKFVEINGMGTMDEISKRIVDVIELKSNS